MLLSADTMSIFHQWTGWSSVHHYSRVVTDSTSWDKQACTRGTLWCQHYITASKEYLSISHILSKYFKLVYLQLQLVKISCKMITIWLGYKRKKKGAFYETPCIYQQIVAEKFKVQLFLISLDQRVSVNFVGNCDFADMKLWIHSGLNFQ